MSRCTDHPFSDVDVDGFCEHESHDRHCEHCYEPHRGDGPFCDDCVKRDELTRAHWKLLQRVGVSAKSASRLTELFGLALDLDREPAFDVCSKWMYDNVKGWRE
mgnify:CR=1 FL=1